MAVTILESAGNKVTRDSVRTMARKALPFWVAAVVTGSFLPGSVKALLGTGPFIPNHPLEWQHRLAHFGTFGLTALLFMLTAAKPREEAARAGAAFLLGCAIELAQYAAGLSPVLEWWDVRDDFLSVAGMFIMFNAARLIIVFRPKPAAMKS